MSDIDSGNENGKEIEENIEIFVNENINVDNEADGNIEYVRFSNELESGEEIPLQLLQIPELLQTLRFSFCCTMI